MGYRDYSTGKGLIVDATGHGDFSTVQAAINAATAGQTVFVRPGTYTENITGKTGIEVVAFTEGYFQSNVIIHGKCNVSGSIVMSFAGITFKTNGDYCITATSGSPNVIWVNCLIQAANSIAINNATTADFQFNLCTVSDLGAGYQLYTQSGAGGIEFLYSNVGQSTATASTNSAGLVLFQWCNMGGIFSSSSTGALYISDCDIDNNSNAATNLTFNGSGSNYLSRSAVDSGSNSCISVGSGAALTGTFLELNSSATNVITGLGTINYAFLTFSGSSSGYNITTATPFNTII